MSLDMPKTREDAIIFLEDLGVFDSLRQASRKTGIAYTTLSDRKKKAEKLKNKLRIRVKANSKKQDFRFKSIRDDVSKVLVLPDMHDSPELDKERFKLIARHATATQPDAIISIGDIADVESLCSHVKNQTFKGRFKPAYLKDLESIAEALSLFEDNFKTDKDIVKHITLGNHEERIWWFVDNNPEMAGMEDLFTAILEGHGWSWTRYGDYYNYQGVDFTHAPLTTMGKPMGGKTALQRVANESIKDIVFGHTHKYGYIQVPKLGLDRRTTAVNVGVGLPQGMVKDYARLNQTGWWWGIVELTIMNGRIEGVNNIPMRELDIYK